MTMTTLERFQRAFARWDAAHAWLAGAQDFDDERLAARVEAKAEAVRLEVVAAEAAIDDSDIASLARVVELHCPWAGEPDEHMTCEELAIARLVRACLAQDQSARH